MYEWPHLAEIFGQEFLRGEWAGAALLEADQAAARGVGSGGATQARMRRTSLLPPTTGWTSS